MKAPTLKKTLYAALCLLLSSLVGLFLSELILRRFIPQPLYKWQQGLFESDPAVFYRLAKNFKAVHTQPEYSYAIRTNSYGFRGPEPRPDASVRVLILGDSFAFGQGVDKGKTLSSLIRAHFRGKGLDVDVLNTAVPGYSLMNEKRILERTLPTYRPHIVFAFFYWNDLIARGSLKVRNGYLVSDDRLSPRELRTFLNQNSHLFTLIKRFSYAFRSSPRNPRGGGHYRDEDVRAAARRLLEMKRLSEGSNARFRVFIIPWEGIGPGSAPWRRSKGDFLRLLASTGLPYIDLEDRLANLRGEERQELVYRYDVHWNEKGHRFFSAPAIEEIRSLLGETPRVEDGKRAWGEGRQGYPKPKGVDRPKR